MKAVFISILILLSATLALGQSHEPFTGAQQNDLGTPQVQKWVKMPGQVNASASYGRDGAGYGVPYHPTGAGYPGFAYYDTVPAPPYEFGVKIGGLASSTTSDFYLWVDNNTTFANGGGYVIRVQQQSGADLIRFGEYNQYTDIGGVEDTTTPAAIFNTNNFYPSTVFTITRDLVAGDSIFFRVWSDRMSAVVKTASTLDSLSITTGLESSVNIRTGSSYRVGVGGYVRSTNFKLNDFFIRTPGNAPPPAGGSDVDPPSAGTLSASRLSAYLGASVYVTFPATDDSALNTYTVEVDTGTGGYHTIGTYTASGAVTSYTYTSPTFTRYTAGNATVRGRISDKTGKLDTSATLTVQFSPQPVSQQFTKRVGGWVTFQDTKWTGLAGGTIPADSLPWGALTHISLFAAGGGAPIPSSYFNQLAPMATRAHQSGVYAGMCYGGSSDAALIAMTNDPNAHSAWINYNLSLIDNQGIDFLEFDYEGTINVGAVSTLFARLYDSLQTRTSDNDPSVAPFIVLTVGPTRAASWVSLEPYVEFVNMMSYDYIGSWWCRLIHDSSPKSYQWYNGTGSVTDYQAGCGVNSNAPSMQEAAKKANNAGWPSSKLLVGFDFNPTYYFGGTTGGTGRGPTYIRQPIGTGTGQISGVSFAGSNPDFASQWPTMATWPTDSLHFDPVAKAYWIHTGTTQADDRLWTLMAYPGRDSGMWATRQVVDSMQLGGVYFWNLGSEIGNPTSTPPGGKYWHFRMIEAQFAGVDSPQTTLNPPTTFSPANNATGVSLTVTADWNDVAGVQATLGYRVQLSTSQAFTSTLKDTAVTPSQISFSGYLSNNTAYYYRVSVLNAAGVAGQWSTPVGFTTIVTVPGAPSLISPVNGATNQGTAISYSWIPPTSGGAVQYYYLQVSTGITFTSLFVDTDSIPAATLALLVKGHTAGGTYYWRVGATNAAGAGVWSSIRSLVVGTSAPAAPILLSPSDGRGSIDTVNIRHVWTTPSLAVNYHLQIATDVNFVSVVKDTFTAGSAYSRASAASADTFWWHVKSIGSTDSSLYSPPNMYVTTLPGASIPEGGEFVMFPTWNPVKRAYEYKRPSSYYAMTRPQGDLSDIPRPTDTNIVYVTPYGLKFGFANSTGGDSVRLWSDILGSGGGGTMTGAAIAESLSASGAVLDSLKIKSATFINDFMMKNAATDDLFQRFLPAVGNSIFDVRFPGLPGDMGVFNNAGQNLSIGWGEFQSPLGESSGGLGRNPDYFGSSPQSGHLFFGWDPSQPTLYTWWDANDAYQALGIDAAMEIINDTTLAELTADQNNLFVGLTGVVKLIADATRTITGMYADVASGVGSDTILTPNGTRKTLINVDDLNNIVLAHKSSLSLAKNQIIASGGTPDTLYPGGSANLWFDGTVKSWRVLSNVPGEQGGSAYTGTAEFPRTANYHFGGGSKDWSGSFDAISTFEGDSTQVAVAKAAYPATKFLVSHDFNFGEPLSNSAAESLDAAWRVKDTLGWYKYKTAPRYLYDMSDLCSTYTGRTFSDALATSIADSINWTIFDGIISEGSDRQPSSTGGCDLDRNGLNDYAEVGKGSAWVALHWANGYNIFVDSLRAKLERRLGPQNGIIVMYNSITDTMGMTRFNGTMLENVLDHAPTLINWISLMKQWDADPTVTSKYHFLAASAAYDSVNAPDPNYKDYFRYMRFTLGMCLMTDAYYMFNDIGNHNYRFYYDEFDADLGYPTGASDSLANGLWYRFYENGVVLANPTSDTITAHVSDISGLSGYNGSYRRLWGAQDTLWNTGAVFDSVVLVSTTHSGYGSDHGNVGDAIILVRDPDTTIADIIVDNAYAGTTPGNATATFTAGFIVDTTSDIAIANPTWNVGPQAGYTNILTGKSRRAHVGSGAYDTTATFTPTITRAGWYNVYEWHGWSGSSASNRAEANNVPHVVTFLGDADTLTVDQEINVGQWNLLGLYYFDIGTAGNVLISNSAGVWQGASPAGEWVIADAIKFVYVRP